MAQTDAQPDKPSEILKVATRSMLGQMMLVSALINVLGLALPLFMMSVFDRVLTSRSMDTLLYLVIATVIAVATSSVLETVRRVALGRIGSWVIYSLSPEVLKRLIERRLIDNNVRSELLREVSIIRTFLTGSSASSLLDVPWLPLFLVVAWLVHPAFGILGLIAAGFLFAIAVVTDRLLRDDLKASTTNMMLAMQDGDSILRNAEIVDSLGMTPRLMERWSGRMHGELDASERIQRRTAIMLGITKFSRAFIQVLLYGIAAMLVLENEMTGGAIIAGSIIVSRLLAPVEQVMGQWRQLSAARDSYRKLETFFQIPRRETTRITLPAPQGNLAVETLTKRLPGRAIPVLRNIDFVLPAGEQLAIVGPAGSGKTTLARLLIGVTVPEFGTVRLDGVDVASWDREDFGQRIGYLPQDVELFAGSVADNISRFSGDSGTGVVNAARFAGCHKMILALPGGYETEIGEGGMMLSGGQRQLIGLARAIYGSPRFVVLDEPNSNLDARGDAALTNALRRLSKARVTTVIITHRSAILHVVDKVLLLNNGAIRMYGPTADVLERHRRDQLPAQSAAEQVAEREPEKEAPPPEGGTLVQVDQA